MQRASFDHAIDPDLDSCRERFEALVSSIRDLLTAGWLRTRQSHDEMNCRGAYYRAMEFLLESAVAENAAQIWGVHPCPIADRDRTTNR